MVVVAATGIVVVGKVVVVVVVVSGGPAVVEVTVPMPVQEAATRRNAARYLLTFAIKANAIMVLRSSFRKRRRDRQPVL